MQARALRLLLWHPLAASSLPRQRQPCSLPCHLLTPSRPLLWTCPFLMRLQALHSLFSNIHISLVLLERRSIHHNLRLGSVSTHGVLFLVFPPVGPAVPLSHTQYVAPNLPLTFSAKPFTTSSVGPWYALM